MTFTGETVKISKCCPRGSTISTGGCEPSSLPFTLDFTDKVPSSYEIIIGEKCEIGR